MRARLFLTVPTILTVSLASCASYDRPPTMRNLAPAVGAVLSRPTRDARKAEIKRQIAKVCPRPLDNDELEWAAQYVEETRSKGAVWIAGRLLKMHRETRVCRGTP